MKKYTIYSKVSTDTDIDGNDTGIEKGFVFGVFSKIIKNKKNDKIEMSGVFNGYKYYYGSGKITKVHDNNFIMFNSLEFMSKQEMNRTALKKVYVGESIIWSDL